MYRDENNIHFQIIYNMTMNGLAHSICKGKRHKKESLKILTEVTDTLSKLETVSAS